MKLLLTSAGFENPNIGKEFLKLVDKPANEIKILFIPTAARSKEEQDYANKSKQELYDLGINYDNIKIYYINNQSMSESEIYDFDAIYVCGGNTFFLLKQLKETRVLIKNDFQNFFGQPKFGHL